MCQPCFFLFGSDASRPPGKSQHLLQSGEFFFPRRNIFISFPAAGVYAASESRWDSYGRTIRATGGKKKHSNLNLNSLIPEI